MFLHSEVDDGRLGGDLRGVVGVAKLGCDVELEVWVKLHLLVSKTNQQPISYVVIKTQHEAKPDVCMCVCQGMM